eukprot:4367277-Pleurochrysis_carterae.AAC.1
MTRTDARCVRACAGDQPPVDDERDAQGRRMARARGGRLRLRRRDRPPHPQGHPQQGHARGACVRAPLSLSLVRSLSPPSLSLSPPSLSLPPSLFPSLSPSAPPLSLSPSLPSSLLLAFPLALALALSSHPA